jgi:PemK-like, MazF-like toxin of type II toxin-antitoxin system
MVCAFTTDPTDAPLFRLPVEPNESNGLRAVCRLMVDKVTTVPKSKIGARFGRLVDEDMVRLNRAVLVFLGIAAPQRQRIEQSPRFAAESSIGLAAALAKLREGTSDEPAGAPDQEHESRAASGEVGETVD